MMTENEKKPDKKSKPKCFSCTKKLSAVLCLMNTCRCDHVFCNKHLKEHQCSFDYQTLHKDKLKQYLPKIIPLKLTKI
jgi:hypothetical protein